MNHLSKRSMLPPGAQALPCLTYWERHAWNWNLCVFTSRSCQCAFVTFYNDKKVFSHQTAALGSGNVCKWVTGVVRLRYLYWWQGPLCYFKCQRGHFSELGREVHRCRLENRNKALKKFTSVAFLETEKLLLMNSCLGKAWTTLAQYHRSENMLFLSDVIQFSGICVALRGVSWETVDVAQKKVCICVDESSTQLRRTDCYVNTFHQSQSRLRLFGENTS